MHFSKTYTQLLLSLPPELRENAIGYGRLKKLINRTVSELALLGLGPSLVHPLPEQQPADDPTILSQRDGSSECAVSLVEEQLQESHKLAIAYEIASNATLLEPRLRLSVKYSSDAEIPSDTHAIYHVDLHIPEKSLRDAIQTLRDHSLFAFEDASEKRIPSSDLIIPLPADTAFFQHLTSDISSLSGNFDALYGNFNSTLNSLAQSISLTSIPASSSTPRSFSAYSLTAGNVSTLRPGLGGKSDLYTWREIFSLYAEAEVFEGVAESCRGERSVEEAERRLKLFSGLAQEKRRSLRLAGSQEAFEAFLKINLFILDVKKLELANSEAIRKILKKHTKLTTLPIPSYLLVPNGATSTDRSLDLALIPRPAKPLPKLFVQAIGEILLPVVPHIDDYSCLICTAIAFKPIRLRCGHFFCVRCLVKLQRRGRADCPMCRAPTVLLANASNVDYALLNFMADWFPIESREKQRSNDREVTQELMEDFRLAAGNGDRCRIM